MNKKRIRQMTASLLRRVTTQPAARYLAPHRAMLTELLEEQGWLQRFAPLFGEERIRCADVLSLCREELALLSPEPEEGWIPFAYDFARWSMFPEPAFASRQREHGAGAVFFLSLLQVLFDAERALLPADPLWQLELLEEDEQEESAHRDSYRLFLRSYRREYVYEMMRLGLEATPWRTLEHIAGVHHVAMHAARGLKRAGVAVDLGLVSASAAGHDIGKFGCRPGERVPYLHYHYTDLWFRRRHMGDIGYVAANHSVWDLELDYLSAESLALIYADFRVKQERGPDGREITRISTLEEAFDVILSKLDNVTQAKRTRYTFVYAKLRDFERWMVSLGVDVSLAGACPDPRPKKDVALMDQREALEELRLLCVEHNAALMSRLTGQRSFAGLLELARGETDWRRLRAYLGVFESYSVYLRTAQKVQTLAFLYELLMHREGDIRRQAAALMGEIIARFHAGYAKERPAGWTPESRAVTDMDQWKLYLEKIIRPDHKLLAQHRRWIGFTLKMVVNSLLDKCERDRRGEFLTVFLRWYRRPERLEDETAFQLLETATALPVEVLADRQRYDLLLFAQNLAEREDVTVRAAAVLLLGWLRPAIATQDVVLHSLRDMDCAGSASLALLRAMTAGELTGESPPPLDEAAVAQIFLDNLKTATPWIIKEINIRLLTGFAQTGGGHLLHIATHLTNLVKVSDQVTVRHAAGGALLAIAPLLAAEERNEVAVELGRGLEIGQQEFSKYIPGYLGRFCLFLPPTQLEEMLSDLDASLCSSNGRVVALALDTVGVVYEEYDTYRVRFPEEDEVYRRRRERLLGMLLKGLAGFRAEVRQEALFVLGRHVFGSETLGRHEKRRAFLLTLKKILALMGEEQASELTFYYRAAMLGRVYRFLTEQELLHGGFRFERIGGGKLTVVNILGLEDYVKGVVANEMSDSWPIEALKAQAVAARSYALSLGSKHSAHHFDICFDTDCQAYYGREKAGANSDAAVDQTAGQVCLYNGKAAQTFYYSSNGGASESVSIAWESNQSLYPYLVGVVDPYEASLNLNNSWTRTVSSSELISKVLMEYAVNGPIVSAAISSYSPTGNPKTVTFTDSAGRSYSVSTYKMVRRLGLRSYRYGFEGSGSSQPAPTVPSEDISINGTAGVSGLSGLYAMDGNGNLLPVPGDVYVITDSGTSQLSQSGGSDQGQGSGQWAASATAVNGAITFAGRGWGHNIGMSQFGAKAMAEQGHTYQQILQFYYTGITVGYM